MVASPLNVIGILREAIKIPGRNGKFMLQLMLTILSPFTLIVLLHYLLAAPVIHKVEESYEHHSSVDQKDVTSLIGLELVFFAIFCIVSFFGMILTIYASASTYLGKNLGLNDLIFSIRFAWKKPLVTWLYVFCLTLIYAVFVTVLIKSFNLLFATNANPILIGSFVGIPAVFCYLYLAASWTLALVVSVLEDHEYSCGTKGLKRSEKLIKGRKIQGFFVMCILAVLSIPIYVLFYVTVTDDDDELGPFAQIGFGFVATLLLCIAKFFTFVVFTVFYCECKQSQGERVDIELEIGYGLVPNQLACKIQVGSNS